MTYRSEDALETIPDGERVIRKGRDTRPWRHADMRDAQSTPQFTASDMKGPPRRIRTVEDPGPADT